MSGIQHTEFIGVESVNVNVINCDGESGETFRLTTRDFSALFVDTSLHFSCFVT
jgi:hypothetical protein